MDYALLSFSTLKCGGVRGGSAGGGECGSGGDKTMISVKSVI